MPIALFLMGGAKRIIALLRRLSFWQLACLALAALAVLQTYRHRDARADADRFEAAYHGERAGRLADRQAYADAQAKARDQMRAENRRIEAEQQRITDDIEKRHAADLARLRNGGLRKDLAAPQGRPGQGGASGVPQAACRDDEANLCVSRSKLLQAAENELTANALRDWIDEQLKVKRD